MDVTVFPAKNGDAILIDSEDELILIDGGYPSTFTNYIKPELIRLAKEKRSLSLLVVSHIDGDHVGGILKFLAENTKENIIPIKEIWHNTYRHMKPINPDPYKGKLTGESVASMLVKNIAFSIPEDGISSGDISAMQGTKLGAAILQGLYNWNKVYKGDAVSTDNGAVIRIGEKITINLLSPDNGKLETLFKYWLNEMYKKGFVDSPVEGAAFDDAYEYLISLEKKPLMPKFIDVTHSSTVDLEKMAADDFPEDQSPTNGSSISFVLESEGKRLMFLSDAHPSLIITSLANHYGRDAFPIQFDLVKIPHHGSVGNSTKELYQAIDSNQFIISTDGSGHNHPDLETIARIVTRPTTSIRCIYFNYPNKAAKLLDNNELKEKYNYQIFVGNGKQPQVISL